MKILIMAVAVLATLEVTAVQWTLDGNTLTSDNGWALTLATPKIDYSGADEKRISDAAMSEGSDGILDLSGVEAQTGIKIVEIYQNVFGANKAENVRCPGITAVVFPESLVQIGNYAFANCTKLRSISAFPVSFKALTYAFQNCTSLASAVDFSACVDMHVIGINAFQGCELVPQVVLPPAVTNFAANCFRDCTNVSAVVATPVSGALKRFMKEADGFVDYWAFGANGRDGALKTVEIPWGGTTVFGKNASNGQYRHFCKQPLSSIRFFGKAPQGNEPFLESSAANYTVSIVCSKRQDEPGWRGLAEELPSGRTPPEGAFGIWNVGSGTTGVKTQWLVWGSSPFDAAGLMLLVR